MKDRLIRGLLCDGEAQFFLIDAKEMVSQAMEIHNCSSTACAVLGRSLMATAILRALEKEDASEVSFIINGRGPIGSVVCVGMGDGRVKGYVANPEIELPLKSSGKLDVGGAVGTDGLLTVIIDDKVAEPYIGTTGLVTGEIAEDLTEYFNSSQQINSLVYLGVRLSGGVKSAVGMVIHLMPGHGEETISKIENAAETIAQLSADMKDGGDVEEWLKDKLAVLEPRVLSVIEPIYSCDCSMERISRALIALGKDELMDVANSEKETTIECHFCKKKYVFSREEIIILAEMATSS